MAAPDTTDEILDVNRRYHDVAAADYDAKWGVDFGDVGRAQVLGKVEKLLGRRPGPFARSLEIGAGTGYFTLNLMQAGVVESAVCTDVSPGMLAALRGNAERLGLEPETAACDAAALPFADGSFDLVLGHAVLHHLPELDRSFAEFMRVLRPGGVLLFAGEPSRYGDRLASLPKRAGLAAAPLWRRLVGARALNGDRPSEPDHALEAVVDVHAFTPADLERRARAAGFADVRVRGEELLANWFGWFNRTLEATAVHDDIPWGWFRYAYRGYLALQKVDAAVLEPHLPAAGFYNLILAARRPT
jgi:SAM-dependent methyltransferase